MVGIYYECTANGHALCGTSSWRIRDLDRPQEGLCRRCGAPLRLSRKYNEMDALKHAYLEYTAFKDSIRANCLNGIAVLQDHLKYNTTWEDVLRQYNCP